MVRFSGLVAEGLDEAVGTMFLALNILTVSFVPCCGAGDALLFGIRDRRKHISCGIIIILQSNGAKMVQKLNNSLQCHKKM